MEAIASSVFIPPFPETYLVLNNSTSSCKTPNKRIGALRFAETSRPFRVRAHVLPSEASGSGEGEDVNPLNTAFGAAFEDVVSFPQIPGCSGLSNARVTIFGDVYPLPEHQQEWAHKQYISKHQQGPSQQWGNFYYFRMRKISDIYFIGGFGTVAWVNVKEYEALELDKIAVDGGEQNLKELNAIFSKPIKELLSAESEVDDAALISIDSKGIDIRVRQGAQFNIQRISFEGGHAIETVEEAKAALWKLVKKGQLYNLQK